MVVKIKVAIAIFLILATFLILVTGFWLEISTFILPNTTFGLYSRPFFEGFLLNSHGTLLDLFLLSIVLAWFDSRRKIQEKKRNEEAQKQAAVTRHVESLQDLRYYRGEDVSYRTWNAIRRLQELGEQSFACPEATLNGIRIKDLTMTGANMRAITMINSNIIGLSLKDTHCEASNFSDARMSGVSFDNTDFSRANFSRAKLTGIDFSSCNIQRANFSGAILRSANFKGVDCRGVKFVDADLRSANFRGATNLTEEMLSAAKDTRYILLQ